MTVSSGMSMNIVAGPKGGPVAAFPYIPDKDEGFRIFKQGLTEAVTNAQDAFKEAKGKVDEAVTKMEVAIGTVDQLLKQNPDPNTPQSLEELVNSVGGMLPTDNREMLEKRVSEVFDLNVVNGLLLVKGSSDLENLRFMAQALGLGTGECDLPDTDKDFLMVTTYAETIERVVGSSCGEDIVEFEVVENKVGENISIEKAAALSGKPAEEILIRFFWYDEIKTDRATQKRLNALGVEGGDLTAVISAPQETDRVKSVVIDTASLDALKGLMSLEDVCTLLSRPDTISGVKTDPAPSDIVKQIRSAISSNTGISNRNKAGTSERAITADEKGVAPAGRAADPAMLLYATVDLAKSLGATSEALDSIDTDGLDQKCIDILAFLDIALSALEAIAEAGRAFFLTMMGKLGNGIHNLGLGIGFTSCLVSLNLGLELNIELSIKLPIEMQLFLAAFAAALAAASAAVLAAKQAICIPLTVINMLFGGVCGFKPFEFSICPPDILDIIDRVRSLINLASGMLSSILSALQVMKFDAQDTARASGSLKAISPCVVFASPLAIGLGLLGALALGDLEASASLTTPVGELEV